MNSSVIFDKRKQTSKKLRDRLAFCDKISKQEKVFDEICLETDDDCHHTVSVLHKFYGKLDNLYLKNEKGDHYCLMPYIMQIVTERNYVVLFEILLKYYDFSVCIEDVLFVCKHNRYEIFLMMMYFHKTLRNQICLVLQKNNYHAIAEFIWTTNKEYYWNFRNGFNVIYKMLITHDAYFPHFKECTLNL